MTKRFFTLLAAILLIIGMTACNSEESGKAPNTTTADPGNISSTPNDQEETKPAQAETDAPEKKESLEFKLSKAGDSYSVAGIGTYTDVNLIIPAEHEGLPVTKVDSISSFTEIKTLILPDSVTSIGNGVFKGCKKLTSVKFGSGLQSIGARAFSGCSALTQVTLPDSCTTLLEDAFSECTALTSINIPDGVITLSDVFEGCTALTSLRIPKTVINISVSDTVKVSFENRENFYILNKAKEKVWLSDTEAINAYLKENLGTITYRDLYGVDQNGILYRHAERSNDLKYTAEDLVFMITGTENEALTEVVIPASFHGTPVVEINDTAFRKNQSITKVRIESGLQTIAKDAFYQCPALTEVFIPASVTSIESGAFAKCSAITALTMEDPSGWVNSKKEPVSLSTSAEILQLLVVDNKPITKGTAE